MMDHCFQYNWYIITVKFGVLWYFAATQQITSVITVELIE